MPNAGSVSPPCSARRETRSDLTTTPTVRCGSIPAPRVQVRISLELLLIACCPLCPPFQPSPPLLPLVLPLLSALSISNLSVAHTTECAHTVVSNCIEFTNCNSCASADRCAWCSSENTCKSVTAAFADNCRGVVFEPPCPVNSVEESVIYGNLALRADPVLGGGILNISGTLPSAFRLLRIRRPPATRNDETS